jgi:hypothetical protein
MNRDSIVKYFVPVYTNQARTTTNDDLNRNFSSLKTLEQEITPPMEESEPKGITHYKDYAMFDDIDDGWSMDSRQIESIQNGSQHLSSSNARANAVLKRDCQSQIRRAVCKRIITASQRRQQEEHELRQQGFQKEEICIIQDFLTWLNESGAESEVEPEMVDVSYEPQPFRLSLLAEKAQAIATEMKAAMGKGLI